MHITFWRHFTTGDLSLDTNYYFAVHVFKYSLGWTLYSYLASASTNSWQLVVRGRRGRRGRLITVPAKQNKLRRGIETRRDEQATILKVPNYLIRYHVIVMHCFLILSASLQFASVSTVCWFFRFFSVLLTSSPLLMVCLLLAFLPYRYCRFEIAGFLAVANGSALLASLVTLLWLVPLLFLTPLLLMAPLLRLASLLMASLLLLSFMVFLASLVFASCPAVPGSVVEPEPRAQEPKLNCLAHLRNLRICDSGMSPRICGFAICGLQDTANSRATSNKPVLWSRLRIRLQHLLRPWLRIV